jgi:low temperature requirement protein LtrA
MWWVYFVVPTAELLHAHRERSFRWGYGHIPLFGAIVATGAGLHAAAYFIEDQSKLNSVTTVLTVAVPVGVYILGIFGLYLILVRSFEAFHLVLMAGTVIVLGAAVALAGAGVTMAVCLIVVMLAPVVTVVGFELTGHRHVERAISRAASEDL